MATYARAAILINRKDDCLYSLGPTGRYLRVAPGRATHDLLAMVRQDTRTNSSRQSKSSGACRCGG
jgi:two-component system CheB/CheR fusion protein